MDREQRERRLVSIPQACKLTGVVRRTIYNWINAHKVEWVRTAGGAIRIYSDTLWRPHDDLNVETVQTTSVERESARVTACAATLAKARSHEAGPTPEELADPTRFPSNECYCIPGELVCRKHRALAQGS